jgi:hypothetical protein
MEANSFNMRNASNNDLDYDMMKGEKGIFDGGILCLPDLLFRTCSIILIPGRIN